MEEKNMRELSMDELDKVSGGALTQKRWIMLPNS